MIDKKINWYEDGKKRYKRMKKGGTNLKQKRKTLVAVKRERERESGI